MADKYQYLLSISDTSVAMNVPNMWLAAPFGINEKKETKKFQNVVNRLSPWHRRLYYASVRIIIEGLNKGVLNLGDTELATDLKEVVVDLQCFKTEKCSSCVKLKSSTQPRPRKAILTISIPAKAAILRFLFLITMRTYQAHSARICADRSPPEV